MQPKKIALMAQEAALDKKAEEPVLLNISRLSSIAYYFLIAHGNSAPHIKAIAENIRQTLKEKGVRPYHVEGLEAPQWVVLDYGTVIIHIFHRELREFYALERLWGEAVRVKVRGV